MRPSKIGLLAVVLAAALSGCAKSPDSTVESFYLALSKGNITEAQGYLSSQIVGMAGPQKISVGLSNASEKIQACGGIRSVDVNLNGEGEIRKGSVKVTFAGNCPAKTETVKLLKENGAWKIGADK